MQITKVINGHEYTFEVPQNAITAKEICRSYDGYKIECEISCNTTWFYKINTGFTVDKTPKMIGQLSYNPETERMTLYKFVDDEKHRFEASVSYGINNEIIKHMRVFDRIVISNKTNRFEISVAKAIKVGQYLHFDKYELQLFVPISEFKMFERKCKKNKK